MATNGKYAILRTAKIKTRGELKRSLKHGFREQDTPNADSKLTPDNTYIGGNSSAEVMQHFEARLATQANIRKNAVLGIEYLVTASPEVINNTARVAQDKYFNDALDWLKEKHGAENIIHAGIHRDEKSPHMYVFVVPIDDKGKLNCRHFLGGSKNVLSELQTEFHEKVANKYGLERGVKGSKAKHQRVIDFYKQINQPDPYIPVPNKRIKAMFGLQIETDESFSDRIATAMAAGMTKTVELAKVARSEKHRADSTEATNKNLSRQLVELRQAGLGLTPAEQKEALKAASDAKRRAMFQARGKANQNSKGQGRGD